MKRSEKLRHGVRQAYGAVAQRPQGEHPFPVGGGFAKSLGYPSALLGGLPSASVDAFCGVSNVALFAEIPSGATVLDLGCGGGLDSLVAAGRVGVGGRVVGVDFTPTMLARARQGARELGVSNVEFCLAEAERLPLADGAIDVALVNGIFNLNPAREQIFRELGRVVRPGGALYGAELILREPLPREVQEAETNWFA